MSSSGMSGFNPGVLESGTAWWYPCSKVNQTILDSRTSGGELGTCSLVVESQSHWTYVLLRDLDQSRCLDFLLLDDLMTGRTEKTSTTHSLSRLTPPVHFFSLSLSLFLENEKSFKIRNRGGTARSSILPSTSSLRAPASSSF